jgi:hypothetical protein
LAADAEEQDEAPVVSDKDRARAGRYALLLAGSLPLQERIQGVRALIKAPDPEAREALQLILQNPRDSLAPLALNALAHLQERGVESTIAKALTDSRPSVRRAATLAVIERGGRKAPGQVLERLRKDSNDAVRVAAALGLGHLKVSKALPDLLRIFKAGSPQLRFSAAWSLWKLEDDRGRRYLEGIVIGDDRNLTGQALLVLSEIGAPESLPIVIQALDSRWQSNWQGAIAALQRWPAEETDSYLMGLWAAKPRSISEGQARRILLVLLERSRQHRQVAAWLPHVLPEASQVLVPLALAEGPAGELLLALNQLSQHPHPAGMEMVLRALGHESPAVVELAYRVLEGLAKALDKESGMPGSARAEAWRGWWIRHCRAERIEGLSGRAPVLRLMGPDGVGVAVKAGARLDWGVRIESTHAGEGAGGPYLILRYGRKRYRIQTVPVK